MTDSNSEAIKPKTVRYIKHAFCISVVAWLTIIAFNLHWSSMGIWEIVIHRDNPSKTILGAPKVVRGDEWIVFTPLLIAMANESKLSNLAQSDVVGTPGSQLFLNLPVKHFSLLFRPHLWGFQLFGAERGVAWLWATKVIGLLFSVFVVVLLLTEHRLISCAASLWFLASSYTQWWLSISLPEIVSVGLLLAVLAFLIFKSKSPFVVAASALGFFLLSVDFTLLLYPPYQITVAHISIAITLSLLIRYRFPSLRSCIIRSIILGCSGLAAVSVLYFIYLDVEKVVTVASQTVYPGKRFVYPGDVPLGRLLLGFTDVLNKEAKFPLYAGNVCEAAGFLHLWPFAVVMILLAILFRKGLRSRELNSLLPILFVTLLHFAWMCTSYFPLPVGKLLGLTMVPTMRTLLSLGLLNILLVCATLNYCRNQKLFNNSVLTVMLLLIISIGLGIYLTDIAQHESQLRFRAWKIPTVKIILSGLIFGLLWRKPSIFACFLVPLVILNLRINPLSSGIGALDNRELVAFASTIKNQDPEARWMTYGLSWHANLLRTSGVRVFNGVTYTPRLDDFKVIDPEGANISIYNRYAHITATSPDDQNALSFRLASVDSYEIIIHPCNEKLQKIGIKYVVFDADPKPEQVKCMTKVNGEKKLDGIFSVYRLG